MPVIAITSHQDNQTVTDSPVTIIGTIDDNTAQVTVNGQSAAVGEGIFTSAAIGLSLGSNEITVIAIDQSNNQITQTMHLVYSDVTPPSIPTVNPPVSPTNTTTQALSGTKEANSSIWINGSEAVVLDTQTVWSAQVNLSEGTSNFAVTSKDASENQSQPPVNVSIVFDTTPPTGSITINNDAPYTNSGNVTLNLSATDGTGTGVSKMQFSNTNNGSDWSPVPATDYATTYPWPLISGDGSKIVYVRFIDAAGNPSSATILDAITLDTTAPAQPTIDSVTSPTNSNSQTITGTKSEDSNSIMVSCNTANVGQLSYPTSTTWLCQLTNLTAGDNNITVIAHDAAENPSSPTSITITYQPAQPLSIAITSPANNATKYISK